MIKGLADRFRAPAPPALLIRRGLERRPVVLAVAALSFVAIFLLREGTSDPGSGLALLYVFPVSLIALELGLAAGLAASALATGLLVGWAATTSAGLDPLAVTTRAAVFVLAGLVAGRFSDRMRGLQLVQQRLIAAGVALARLEDAGTLGELVARHALGLPGVSGARVILENGVTEVGRVGRRPLRIALDRADPATATLEVELRGGIEERAAISMLALEASVARENQRLLESERERAALQAELDQANDRLQRHQARLRDVLESQERERSDLAERLHEETAQIIAAELIGLGMVERELDSDLSASRIAELRSGLEATLDSLRSLAMSLRPPSLQALGLGPALEHLADSVAGLERVDVQLGSLEERLGPDLETAIFRLVEDAARGSDGDRTASIRYDDRARELRLTLRALKGGSVGNLEMLRARAGLLDGRVSASGNDVTVRIPLPRSEYAGRRTAPI